MTVFASPQGGPARLRAFLESGDLLRAPGCADALSARVIEAAGFDAAFLGGFSVSATRLGLPDVGLLSYGEMIDQARSVTAATSLPVIGDGDTGYGNPVNAQRTLLGAAQAGLACVMIEDQRWPKRCGHTEGKDVVDRDEARQRIEACVRARDQHGIDILIMARTDACATHGFDEALARVADFADAGADITFLEAPESEEQMARYCAEVPGWKTANLVEDGRTPWLDPDALTEIGYSVVLYPVSLLLHSARALQEGAARLAAGTSPDGDRVTFDEIRELVGWAAYEDELGAIEAE